MRGIIRNRTGIEDWIVEKANFRRRETKESFKFPYDVGVWNNIKQVLNWNCLPVGDGITWVVAEGCDQYTLTVGFELSLLIAISRLGCLFLHRTIILKSVI